MKGNTSIKTANDKYRDGWDRVFGGNSVVNGCKARVDEIRGVQDDDEVAHSLEDVLYKDVLSYIAVMGGGEISDLAMECLKTKEIEFSRWCA